MAIESNIFEWIGESIDMTLNTFVQVTSGNVISMFTDVFIYGGTLTFVLMGFAIIFGYVEAPASNFMKTCGKFIVLSGLAMSAPTYLLWVVEALRGLETGVADAFSASGSSTQATSVYQVLDKAVTDGFKIGGDMLEKMGKRQWYEYTMAAYDFLNAVIIYLATLLVAVPAGAMVIVSKIMLTVMLGIGPFFIAMLMFPVTAKWFDSWFGQVMTYIMQIALVTTVLGMGMKFFSTLTATVLASTTDHPIATMLEILIVTGVTLFLLQKAFEAAAALAGGMSSAGITLRQVTQAAASPVTQVLNRQSTRRDLQSGMMVTGGRLNHLAAGNTMWNPAYRQHIMENLGKNWGLAKGGRIGRD
jgi:type IV secretion system protein VirB6